MKIEGVSHLKILAIDTATDIEIISVSNGDRNADASSFIKNSHSITILDNINKCLNELELSATDLQILGVGIGPGSFTGIRIAITTIRMLSQVLNIPLVGVKTHLLYANSASAENNENILVAFDAKKGRVFGALYKKIENEHIPREIVPPGDYTIDQLIDKTDITKRTLTIGNGINRYSNIVSDKLKKRKNLEDMIPSGKKTCELILDKYNENKEDYNDYMEVVPYYSRKSDAEILKK